MLNKIFISLFLAALFITGCTKKEHPVGTIVVSRARDINAEVQSLLSAQFDEASEDSVLVAGSDTIRNFILLHALYRSYDFRPLITGFDSLSHAGKQLQNLFDSIGYSGINPHEFKTKDLISRSIIHDSDSVNVSGLFRLNLLLPDLFIQALKRVHRGSAADTSEFDREFIESRLIRAFRFNRFDEALQSAEPDFQEYANLKNAFRQVIDSIGYEEYFSGHIDSAGTDAFLRANKIVVNMDRWRLEKNFYEDFSIHINIPSYSLKMISFDTVTLHSKIICGHPETPTPANLDSKIRYFYVYPYWFIPFSIATKEILPRLKYDTTYLRKHNIDVLDRNKSVVDVTSISWKKFSEKYFPYTLRQRDGDENTLGVLKFIFPNKYAIYLHDTNAPGLFRKKVRALSHGCIRIENARSLAMYFSYCCTNNFTLDSLNHFIKIKKRKQVILSEPVAIHIRYYTAVGDSSGIQFYDDVYHRDSIVLQYIFRKPDDMVLSRNVPVL